MSLYTLNETIERAVYDYLRTPIDSAQPDSIWIYPRQLNQSVLVRIQPHSPALTPDSDWRCLAPDAFEWGTDEGTIRTTLHELLYPIFYPPLRKLPYPETTCG